MIQVPKEKIVVAVAPDIQSVPLKTYCVGGLENEENIDNTVYIASQKNALIGGMNTDSSGIHPWIAWDTKGRITAKIECNKPDIHLAQP